MEQPPGSLDDLQPQDLSTSGLPAVIDLTRNEGEECVLGNASLDALRMVKSPGWFPDPSAAAANPGLQYSETVSPDAALQPAAQIQPDNAFSHTTVTLSYVSRSHVFSAHDALSHSPLYSLQPISKFSLHPPLEADKGLGDAGFALSQADLAAVETSVDHAVQTDPQSLLLQAEAGESPVQQVHEVNGEAVPTDGHGDEGVRGEEERETCPSKDEAFENGKGDNWSSSGVCADSSPETLTPVTGEEEVLFVMAKKGGAGAGSESAGATDLCPISREYISPLEDPLSPSATSLDDAEDLFVLPQASCSPSGDPSFLEDAACDGSSTEGDAPLSSGTDEGAARLDSSEENKPRARKRKALLEPLIDLTDDNCLSGVLEKNRKKAAPHFNGNAKTLDKTLKERKLPVRSGRGTRLEAIVMDINSTKYKVSGCIRSKKKPNASSSDSSLSSPKRKDTLAVSKQKGKEKATLSAKTKQRGQTNHLRNCKGSTSDSELLNNSKKSQSSSTPKTPPPTVHTRSKKESPPAPLPRRKPSSLPSSPSASEEIHSAQTPLPPKSPKKSPGKAKSKSPCSKASSSSKTKSPHTPKRRRKKPKPGCSPSMFSPREPEIKLRYVNYKEEKRDPRLSSFSPFVHVERRQATPSLCTVINYPDEVRAPHGRGQPQGGFMSAAVPSTSCLLLGRVSAHSQHQRPLVCCICGRSANAMDLGDLHGPYYPEGHRPDAKAPAGASGLKEEEDYSDSDSSLYSVRGRGRRRAAPPAPWLLRPGAQLKQKAPLADHHRWPGEGAGSPAGKQARSDPASANMDWYSPPTLPLDPCEYWLHEDCAIWSAGVFLVKGKVYGLEEAIKVAQETVCSACHHPGATLGCFFKGCPSKYHYRCALESDCVLIEENFSMKCKKHKNKTFKGVPGQRLNIR